jgi:hypothetical protein
VYCLTANDVGVVTPEDANKPNTNIIERVKDFAVHGFVRYPLSVVLCKLPLSQNK